MNIDIKSVLIGVLLTTSIMLVMAFDDHEKDSEYEIEGMLSAFIWFDNEEGNPIGAWNYGVVGQKDTTKQYNIMDFEYSGDDRYVSKKEFYKYLKDRKS